jgi:V/A-type H+/Na+-transporting ATPase subunit G/H
LKTFKPNFKNLESFVLTIFLNISRISALLPYQQTEDIKMEDTLKRLLLVETQAEQLVAKAQTEREQIIQQALQESHQAEQQLKAKMPEIRTNLLEKAEERATQTIAELNKRYLERQENLHNLAEENQPKALEAAIHLLMQVGQPR